MKLDSLKARVDKSCLPSQHVHTSRGGTRNVGSTHPLLYTCRVSYVCDHDLSCPHTHYTHLTRAHTQTYTHVHQTHICMRTLTHTHTHSHCIAYAKHIQPTSVFVQVVSLTKSSEAAPYHALQQGEEAHWEVCERMLFVYSKINKGLRYVQVREMY